MEPREAVTGSTLREAASSGSRGHSRGATAEPPGETERWACRLATLQLGGLSSLAVNERRTDLMSRAPSSHEGLQS